MAVEDLFWRNLNEYGSVDCIDITFHGRNYQVVSDPQTRSYLLYETDRPEGDDILLKEFSSLENMLDEPYIEGLGIRQILQQIEVKDYFWH